MPKDYVKREDRRHRLDELDPTHPQFLRRYMQRRDKQNKIRIRANAVLAADFDLSGTSDPILAYMQRHMETMGLAYMPEDLGGENADAVRDRCLSMTQDAFRELAGPHWDRATNLFALTTTSKNVLFGRTKMTPGNAHHIRIVQLALLTHIGGIREHLSDIERNLWVAMQHSHDPRISTHPSMAQSAARSKMRHKIMRQLGTYRKIIAKPYYMPLRVIASAMWPEFSPQDALEYEKARRIATGELTEAWRSHHGRDIRHKEDHELVPPERERESTRLERVEDRRKRGLNQAEREQERKNDHQAHRARVTKKRIAGEANAVLEYARNKLRAAGKIAPDKVVPDETKQSKILRRYQHEKGLSNDDGLPTREPGRGNTRRKR